MNAPLPKNEAARLQALHDYAILDSGEEQVFDNLTKLASYICATPIALLSFVDCDRQWVKSRVGLQITQTPRENTFCAHAILEPEQVMIVEDAGSDFRFNSYPLVTQDPRIRFYAGAPLLTPAGTAVGAICALDYRPRSLSLEQIDALRVLSQLAISQLEQRRVLAEVDRNAADLRGRLLQLVEKQTQLEAQNAGLEALSITDALTTVKNRRGFDRAFQEELARASRDKIPLSLLIIDVDNFKSFNDAFGHPAGDEALVQVARILAARARPFDRVARYGGEEFAVILPNTGAYSAVTIGERLRRSIEDASWPHRNITVSVGANTFDDEMDSAVLTARADRALYWVKQSGGNRVAHANQYFGELDQAKRSVP